MSSDDLKNDGELVLGKTTGYPTQYDPNLLFAIRRDESRRDFVGESLPFHGDDIWNIYDLTWLDNQGLPVAATAELRVPASSPCLIESKSLKLYLNSFAMTRFADNAAVADTMGKDLGTAAGAEISVRVDPLAADSDIAFANLPGQCLDTLPLAPNATEVDASLLRADASTKVEERLHSHLLRSLCPVTTQPDIGSLYIHYHGPKIDGISLLHYVVSFREHNDFHEACVERMFVDLMRQCEPDKLSVYARYQRRGGIDINPFRSDFEECPENWRLWRQ